MLGDALLLQMIKTGGGGVRGMRKATKACAYVAAWGIVRRTMDHDPNWEEYTAHWRQSRATTGREVQAFLECVPEGVTVSHVWALVEGQVEKSARTRDAAVSVGQARVSL
jgi:hypothetical protein